MFTFYINGQQVQEPREFDGYEQEPQRDYKNRFLYIAFPGSFTISANSGYTILRELFVSDTCSTARYEAFQTCGTSRYPVITGTIILADCQWNLEKCTVEVDVQDDGVGSSIKNNLRIPISPRADKSKNGASITPVEFVELQVFDPTDSAPTYLPDVRYTYDWYDAIQHAVQYMTDGAVTVTSEWYETLPDSERIALVRGHHLRTASTDANSTRVSYNFNEVWLEVANRYNLWMVVQYDALGVLFLSIEQEEDTFSDDIAMEVLNQPGIVQSVDRDQLYSSVVVGDPDGLQNLTGISSDGSLPYLVLVGFSEEKFHFEGVCNIDEELDLTAKWHSDSNLIERVLVLDPSTEDYDKDIFLLQYTGYLGAATKGTYLNPGADPYLYNEQMLNVNVLNRYALPSNVGQFYDSTNAEFRASGSGPANGESLTAPPTVGAAFDYPLTGGIAIVYTNDSTPPNINLSGAWDIGTQRYTAPAQGYYEFSTDTNYSWAYFVSQGPIGVSLDTLWQRYSSANVLLETYRFSGPITATPNTYSSGFHTASFVMNAGDYMTVTWIRKVTRIFSAGNSSVIVTPIDHVLQTTFVAAGGGVVTSVDALEARTITYEFERQIPMALWNELTQNITKAITFATREDAPFKAHVQKVSRSISDGMTKFKVIGKRNQVR